MRPPSPEVVAAVEQAMLGHVLCDCLPDSATRAEMMPRSSHPPSAPCPTSTPDYAQQCPECLKEKPCP